MPQQRGLTRNIIQLGPLAQLLANGLGFVSGGLFGGGGGASDDGGTDADVPMGEFDLGADQDEVRAS